MSFNYLKKMPTPEEIKEQLPVPAKIQEIKKKRDQEIADIITGKDDRFLCIIGPCSADNEDAVCEYINKLARVADDIKDKVFQEIKAEEIDNEDGKEAMKWISKVKVCPTLSFRVVYNIF